MDRAAFINLEATPTAFRRTRGALADLSRQMTGVTVSLLTSTPNNQMPSSLDTPASSPEEMVIKHRGKKNPVTWSPFSVNEVRKLAQYEVTPPKDLTPTRAMLGLRISPRKRLQLNETGETTVLAPQEKIRKISIQCSNNRKTKIEDAASPVPLNAALKGLSQAQLIELIQKMAQINQDVKQMLDSSIPEPDLQPMLEELSYLRKNIFKSLPNCRLSSQRDSAAFNKASVHLSAFKKCLLENCKQLVESKQWKSVIDFTLSAWSHVAATPTWDNAQHNSVRKHCFKALASSCLKALKSYDKLDNESRLQIKNRLENLKDDSDDLEMCTNFINSSIIHSDS